MEAAVAREDQQPELLDRLFLPGGTQRARDRVSLLQFRHRSRADHRGDRASAKARRCAADHHPLPAREYGRPHGRRLCLRHRARPGRARACRCRHRQHRHRDAQHLPQPIAGAADGRQGAVHDRQRARRLARHLRAFRAGAVRSGEPGAPLSQMGMDASVRRRGEGGAAPRPLDHAERAARAGLPDDAARDADPALERGRGAPLRRRAARQHERRRRRSEADRRSSSTGCSRPRARS